MNNEMMTMLNQSEVFGHEDSRLLFMLGKNEQGNTMINVMDIRTETSKLITTSKPIDDMSEEEIIIEAKRNKEFALDIMNNYKGLSGQGREK